MAISIDLSGTRLLVVGASSGIGRATALAAAAAGADLVVVGRREKQLAEVIEIAGRGTAVAADVRTAGEAARAVTAAAGVLGGLDAVFMPIGSSPLQFIARTDQTQWTDSFATNVVAPAFVAAAAVTVLEPNGLLAFTSSHNVELAQHGLGAYGASKAALDHSIKTWRVEHPEQRFLRIVIGATTPTDLYKDYPADVIAEVLPKWSALGLMAAQFMEVGDVGRAIAEALAFVLAHPGINVEELSLKPLAQAISTEQVQALVDDFARGEGP